MSRFYDGLKIEVNTICKNKLCNKNIVWYNLFPQSIHSNLKAHIIACDENVSGAKICIHEQTDNSIKVTSKYRCRFCDEYHEVDGTIEKDSNNNLVFTKNK